QRVELAPPDVDGVDAARTRLEQHLSEAACRGADIERRNSGGIEPEMGECRRQLESAAGHESVCTGKQRDVIAIADLEPGLGLSRAVHHHAAARNEIARPRACRHEFPIHQSPVKTYPNHPLFFTFSAEHSLSEGRGLRLRP